MPDSYERQTWVNGFAGGTPLNSTRLNHVEAGLDEVAEVADDLVERVESLEATGEGGSTRYVGTSTDRLLVAPGAGVEFFDTTLGYPVWGSGVGWVKADGTAAPGSGSSNAPQNFRVVVNADRTATLTWDSVGSATSYSGWWIGPSGPATFVTGLLATTATTNALTAGTVYTFWVTAVVSGAQSAASNTVQFTVPAVSGGGGASSPADALNINGLNGSTGGHWNLGIGYRPSDPEGGVHKDTTWQQLKDGWSDNRYLKLNGAGDGVVLRVYADGGRTSTNTKYPRDEFRELQSNGTTKATWNGTSGTHTLEGKTKVTHFMAQKPEVVIAQIHDANDDRILITVEGGSEDHVVVDVNGTELTDEPILTGYTTGDEIHWKIQYSAASGGTLKVYIANVLKLTKTGVGLGSSGNYFKVGAYSQANNRDQSNSASDYFEVELRDLVCTHA